MMCRAIFSLLSVILLSLISLGAAGDKNAHLVPMEKAGFGGFLLDLPVWSVYNERYINRFNDFTVRLVGEMLWSPGRRFWMKEL